MFRALLITVVSAIAALACEFHADPTKDISNTGGKPAAHNFTSCRGTSGASAVRK